MFVVKHSGQREPVKFDKVTARIKKLCSGLHELVNPVAVAQKVVAGVYDGVTTTELDTLAAETAASLASQHPDYSLLAGRLAVSSLHKAVGASFAETIAALHDLGLVSSEVQAMVAAHAARLDAEICHARDFDAFDYFAIRTLQRSYLLTIDGRAAERPQHMWMRVAVGIHTDDVEAAVQSYHLMSQGWFTHASPTLFNAATPRPALSSCFLLTMKEDSVEGIYDTLKRCALISKSAGGIGLAVHDVRAQGSYIAGTNGTSNGLVPMLRVFNDTARYCDQGGQKRKGAFAMYLEPWHADILAFLELRKNHGKEELRARDLFYGLWLPDLFMRRVEAGGSWSLFCPHEAPGLADAWGPAFDELYERYEQQDCRARRTMRAQDLWFAILAAQQETGTPYMMFKDACNAKSNQQNLGTIKCANLCTEVVQYTAPDEVAVCTLASLALPRFVVRTNTNNKKTAAQQRRSSSSSGFIGSLAGAAGERCFDFKRLAEVVAVVATNLDKIIDINYYPIPEAKHGHQRHRPIGIGVQGLADVFMLLGMAYDSPEAAELNTHIFETIYHAALTTSCRLAQQHGPYATYAGSPISKGILQPDMWGIVQPTLELWDWAALRADIARHGVRNSLLVAPMPTASTAQILGNTEGFEPLTANIYCRRTLAGEYVVMNKHLVADLLALDLWTPQLRNELVASGGSIQGIAGIPEQLCNIYKTVWEIKQRAVIDMAAARGAYIDQSQSLNVHMADATVQKLSSLHFYAWRKGLKASQYYLRTRAAASAIKFTVDQEMLKPPAAAAAAAAAACSMENGCLSCGA